MNIISKFLSLSAFLLCLLQVAQASPRLSLVSADPLFNQATLIGKVFHDRNANGYQDLNEEGIPGVRLATVTGLLIETDGYGRFHYEETSREVQGVAQNIVIKLDTSSLPQGAELTTENPRVLRSSNMGMNKLNFGVNMSR